jgi:hypothetical protein
MQLSDTERHKIVFEFERCKSIRKVSGKLGYHRNTVRKMGKQSQGWKRTYYCNRRWQKEGFG